MPIYEYRCSSCQKVFERTRRMSEAGEPGICECGGLGGRIISRIAPDHDRKITRLGDPSYLD